MDFEKDTMEWINLWKVVLLLQEHDITLKPDRTNSNEYAMDCSARFPYCGADMTYNAKVFDQLADVPFDLVPHELLHINSKELETLGLDRHATAQQIDWAEERLTDKTKKIVSRIVLVALFLISGRKRLNNNLKETMQELVKLLNDFDTDNLPEAKCEK
jgi:hypothetical protein